MSKSIVDVGSQALDKGQLEDLLLGTPEYRYRPRHSPSPYNTDLAAVLGILYDTCPPEKRKELAIKLAAAVRAITKRYEGIVPAASVILIEASRKKTGNAPVDLPLQTLSSELKNSIAHYHAKLAVDKTDGGRDYADGLLGELRRISANVSRFDGPAFF